MVFVGASRHTLVTPGALLDRVIRDAPDMDVLTDLFGRAPTITLALIVFILITNAW